MAYHYDIEYKKSVDHFNADALYRLPVGQKDQRELKSPIFLCSSVDSLPVSAHEIQLGTSRDPVLSKMWSYTMNGWSRY